MERNNRIGMEINELENRENLPNQNWFFGKISRIDKLYLHWPRKKKKIQITKIRNERVYITTNLAKIKMTLREYYKLYANKVVNLGEMEKL